MAQHTWNFMQEWARLTRQLIAYREIIYIDAAGRRVANSTESGASPELIP